MTWETHIPGVSNAFSVDVSDSLFDAIKRYVEDKDCRTQDLFNTALTVLWELYSGNANVMDSEDMQDDVNPQWIPSTITDNKKLKFIPKPEYKIDAIRNIIRDNRQPKKIEKNKRIYIRFRGEHSYSWVCYLEKKYLFFGFNDFIRRVISWYLREMGYLKKL